MRLLNVSLRNFLFYTAALLLISIPISFFVVHAILEKEVNESLYVDRDQFIRHIKNFEYLEDLETDLKVFDQIAYDVDITKDTVAGNKPYFTTASIYDTLDHKVKPYRELVSMVIIKGNSYKLTLRRSLLENNDLVLAIGSVQTALMFLLGLVIIIINRSLSKRLWKPFYTTLNKLKAFELDKNERFEYELSRIIEFDDLNNAVQHLVDKNKMVFNQQKEFIENASHELQTPLAIFHSKLDLLMQNKNLNEEQASLIRDLIETTQRIAKLNKSLLLLSKIENQQFAEKEDIDVESIVMKTLENIKPLTEHSAITTSTDISKCRIVANFTLTEILITNILRNAYQHNIHGGSVSVVLTSKEFIVTNTGEPLKIPTDKIFQRFNKASGNTSKSTGLGLAIVKEICDLSSYKIAYSYQHHHHRLSVTFHS